MKAKHPQGSIAKNQDVSQMIGNIGWNGHSIVTITGQCEKTGLPKINGRISAFISNFGIRNDIPFTDITGLSVRQAKAKILHDYPTTFTLNERQLKQEINNQ